MFKTIINYLSQASTYKGLFTLLAAFGVIASPELSQAITATALAVVGLINVIMNEKKA